MVDNGSSDCWYGSSSLQPSYSKSEMFESLTDRHQRADKELVREKGFWSIEIDLLIVIKKKLFLFSSTTIINQVFSPPTCSVVGWRKRGKKKKKRKKKCIVSRCASTEPKMHIDPCLYDTTLIFCALDMYAYRHNLINYMQLVYPRQEPVLKSDITDKWKTEWKR